MDNTTQPSIMVVPWVPVSADILQEIESKPEYREVIIAIDDHFKSREFNTKNFSQHLANIRREEGINRYSDSQSEIDAVIARAGPDIWIKTEIMTPSMAGNSSARALKITLQGIHRVSSENLASKVFGGSNYSYISDYGQRARVEMDRDDQFDAFLNDLNASFERIREEGVNFSLSVVCYQGAEVRLDVEVGDDFEELSDFISDYVRKASFKSSPQASISSSTKLAWDNIKVPLMVLDGGDCVNYDIKKHFLNPLRKMIRNHWAPRTDLMGIYPHVKNDGVGKWILTLCDSREDCPRE